MGGGSINPSGRERLSGGGEMPHRAASRCRMAFRVCSERTFMLAAVDDRSDSSSTDAG